jgi:flagellar hook-associated protein 2
VGLSFQNDGSLTLDEAKFAQVQKADPTGVANLFSLVENGVGKRIPDVVDDFISSARGSLTFRERGVQANIDRIDQKIASEQERISAMQDRLTQQFSDLEKLVSQLKSQNDYLVQRLSVASPSSK